MDEPALTQAVKTDLPSPKPIRRKRLVLRFAVLVAAVSALGASYWFTRPPELVWWRSPEIGKTGLRVRVLIPTNWHMNVPLISELRKGEGGANYSMSPVDARPRVIRLLFPRHSEAAKLGLNII